MGQISVQSTRNPPNNQNPIIAIKEWRYNRLNIDSHDGIAARAHQRHLPPTSGKNQGQPKAYKKLDFKSGSSPWFNFFCCCCFLFFFFLLLLLLLLLLISIPCYLGGIAGGDHHEASGRTQIDSDTLILMIIWRYDDPEGTHMRMCVCVWVRGRRRDGRRGRREPRRICQVTISVSSEGVTLLPLFHPLVFLTVTSSSLHFSSSSSSFSPSSSSSFIVIIICCWCYHLFAFH